MKAATTLIAVGILALLGAGAAYWLVADAGEDKNAQDVVEGTYKRPKVWPKATDPEPASPVYHDVKEPAPTEEQVDNELADSEARIERELELAVNGKDSEKLEAARVFLLPELLQVAPKRALAVLERQKPGPARDQLRDHIAQAWYAQDPRETVRWLKSLDDAAQRAAALAVVTDLAPLNPQAAGTLATEFKLKRDERLRRLLSAAN